MSRSVDLSAWGECPPLFVRLLAAAVARGTYKTAAEAIEMNRSTVSTVLANRYPSLSTAGVERRVLEKLGQDRHCPVEGQAITALACIERHSQKPPLHNPRAMQDWKACRACTHNPHCVTAKENNDESASDRIAVESADA
ncbi:hypothetical protein [Pseudomonas aeruginosa]|uniref:hypothetical protein n=1 Tax=Pseudomonas aeruginosa TaxID=287 RepID=UPI000FC42318|nr:hypothetical protein [Pseudomonas aeruginosa]RUI34568.1 hypothetical protein IPC443_03570 [Pseudomonas aeruginosa]